MERSFSPDFKYSPNKNRVRDNSESMKSTEDLAVERLLNLIGGLDDREARNMIGDENFEKIKSYAEDQKRAEGLEKERRQKLEEERLKALEDDRRELEETYGRMRSDK